jgi:hypothetical protein
MSVLIFQITFLSLQAKKGLRVKEISKSPAPDNELINIIYN